MGDSGRSLLLAAWRAPGVAPEAVSRDVERLARDSTAWEGAAALARRVGQEPLLLALARGLEPEPPLSPQTLADLENQTRFHAFRWAEIAEGVCALLEESARRGVRPLLLKGIGLVGDCYDPAHLRPMRDIDILVREDEIARAEEAAEAAGFRAGKEGLAAEEIEEHHHLPPRFHEGTGICLEIHHRLVRPRAGPDGFPPVADFWASAGDSRLFPGKALVPSPTMASLLVCQHVTHADKIGRRAQNLTDLVRVLDLHGAAIDWGRLVAYARAPDVARCLTVPLDYLASEGIPSAPGDRLEEIRSLSGFRGWELSLLGELIRRYRIGAPPPWKWVSGRISNILWRETIARGAPALRAIRALAKTLRRDSRHREGRPG